MSMLAAEGKSQFIIATHSPILLTFPGAQILAFDGNAVRQVSLEDTSHFQITKGILHNPGVYWRHLKDSVDVQERPTDTPSRGSKRTTRQS
jgi:predicted ATPase